MKGNQKERREERRRQWRDDRRGGKARGKEVVKGEKRGEEVNKEERGTGDEERGEVSRRRRGEKECGGGPRTFPCRRSLLQMRKPLARLTRVALRLSLFIPPTGRLH